MGSGDAEKSPSGAGRGGPDESLLNEGGTPALATYVNLLIPIVMALAIVLSAFARPRTAVILFLYAILFCPYVRIGAFEFRLEHFVAPLLLGVIIARRPDVLRRVARCRPLIAYLIWFGWCLAVTAYRAPHSIADFQSWVGLYGVVRPALIMAIGAAVAFDTVHIKGLFIGFAVCAIPLAYLAVGQTLNLGGVRWLTEQAYVSDGRDVFLRSLESESQGYMIRGISVFENASYAGTFYVLALLAAAWFLIARTRLVSRGEKGMLILAAGFAAVGGVFAMSATFMMGVVAIGVGLFARTSLRAKSRMIVSAVGIIFLLGMAVYLLPPESVSYFKEVFEYQQTRLTSGDVFIGRFMDADKVSLLPAWQMTFENPWFGFGYLPPEGVIVNDSLYVTLLFSGGGVGLILFCSIFLRSVAVRNHDVCRQLIFLWVGLMFIVGFGCPSFFNPRMGEWVWVLVAAAASRGKAGNSKSTDASTVSSAGSSEQQVSSATAC